jgi:rod shape determining protein RodA
MKLSHFVDVTLFVPIVFICAISLIVLSSINIEFFQSQLINVVLGLLLFFGVSFVSLRAFKNYSVSIYIFCALLLVSLFFIGLNIRGSRRWVEIFGVTIQFSEIVKPFLIVAMAGILARWNGRVTIQRLLVNGIFFGFLAVLLLRQPDLGNMLIFLFTYVFMLLQGGMNIAFVFGGIGGIVVAFPLIWHLLAEYQKHRIITFINPGFDPLGVGYNAIQSMIAAGSGLFVGRGLGRGVQSQLQFLPERHTDFIFATFSEEFGFVGTAIVLALYFMVLFRLLQIAQNARSTFEAFIVYGVFATMLIHTFINIGMNLGVVPITGVTLPLFSYGGSSILATMLMLGFANVISRGSRQKQDILEIH